MKRAVLIAVVVAVVVCAVPAWSQRGPGGPGKGGPGMAVPPPPPATCIDRIATALGLTADQATALSGVLSEIDAKLQPLMQTAGDANKAVRDAFVAADFTSAAGLLQAVADTQLAVTKASLAGWAEIKASGILTDAQFATLLAGPGPAGPPPSGSSTGTGSTTGRRR